MLYIHIPFCVKKCVYCDFNSYAGISHLAEEYVSALIKEMRLYKGKTLETIYIGGGTPSILKSELIYNIISECHKNFTVSEDAEITVEANPGTLSLEFLEDIKSFNINRISLGVQSFNDNELKLLGRIHTSQEIIEAIKQIKKFSFNLNVDLMFGIMSQTIKSFENSLKQAVSFEPDHISCYNLIVEKGTKAEEFLYLLPNEEIDEKMYYLAIDILAENEYNQYEISNFSKSGKESRHNINYWKCKEYIGIGAGAHSYLNGVRFSNIKSPFEYIKNGNIKDEVNILTEKDMIEEFIFLGLRMLEGINEKEFFEKFHVSLDDYIGNKAKLFMENGFLNRKNGGYSITRKGLYISNYIISRLL